MPDDRRPPIADPANRTRLAWARTALAFAAIGGVIAKVSPVAGAVVVAMSVPIWVLSRRISRAAGAGSSAAELRFVTLTVVLVAAAALVVSIVATGPTSLGHLLHLHGR